MMLASAAGGRGGTFDSGTLRVAFDTGLGVVDEPGVEGLGAVVEPVLLLMGFFSSSMSSSSSSSSSSIDDAGLLAGEGSGMAPPGLPGPPPLLGLPGRGDVVPVPLVGVALLKSATVPPRKD
jgi:hypothetical protein